MWSWPNCCLRVVWEQAISVLEHGVALGDVLRDRCRYVEGSPDDTTHAFMRTLRSSIHSSELL